MKVGFIGAGNMASAMIGGMLQKGLLQKEDIIASSATQKTADRVAQEFGIRTTLDNKEVAKAEIVILAIKPIYCEGVIREIRDQIGENQIVVTIVAGRSLQWLSDTFGKPVKLIRTMPNTPALVGEAVTALCPGELVTDEELEEVCRAFDGCGRCRQRKFSGLCFYVYRGYGRCSSGRGNAAGAGISVRGTVSSWQCQNGTGNRKASGRAQGYGMFSGRYNHCRSM